MSPSLAQRLCDVNKPVQSNISPPLVPGKLDSPVAGQLTCVTDSVWVGGTAEPGTGQRRVGCGSSRRLGTAGSTSLDGVSAERQERMR